MRNSEWFAWLLVSAFVGVSITRQMSDLLLMAVVYAVIMVAALLVLTYVERRRNRMRREESTCSRGTHGT